MPRKQLVSSLAALAAMIFLTAWILSAALDSQFTTPQPEAPPFVADPALQAKRLAFVKDLVNQGFFAKVERPGRVPHIWVTTRFMALGFDDKKAFCNTTFSWYYPDPEADKFQAMRLFDSSTGKQVGRYSLFSGLTLH